MRSLGIVSVVVNDIKSDLYQQTAGYRKTLGKVYLIVQLTHLAFSQRFRCFRRCRRHSRPRWGTGRCRALPPADPRREAAVANASDGQSGKSMSSTRLEQGTDMTHSREGRLRTSYFHRQTNFSLKQTKGKVQLLLCALPSCLPRF